MDEVALKCPVCGGKMIRAIGLRGPKPGSTFWGCENYPDCIPIIKDKDVDAEKYFQELCRPDKAD